ncbi:SGNH/GDSL hydrolase family protein [Dactylosporangium vinaceum]|uniref:SGNH/GDSL hydrolase family protein n=1 Tax=Dactylosporangium vinaceum TaxID=53362 RepID=A0ABV5MFY9_9ACTN|nr:SGNH/GDSL hydrolase family protein [Dactylosporangium vinaceum]UAB98912.1 SGNH/GDSL hydrolase family protein [Dactylosporangium vinaceum]
MRYVAIGDSFTEGMGDERADGTPRGWADLVAAGIAEATGEPVQYANLAIRGRLLGPILDEQLDVALGLDPAPTMLSLNGGGNDMMRRGTDIDRLLELTEVALRKTTAAGVKMLLLSGADPSEHLPFGHVIRRKGTILSAAVTELAAKYDALFVNIFGDQEIRRAPYWSADRLHLNANGHRRVAGLVLTALGHPTTAHRVDPGPASARGLLAEAKYYREHVLPWVTRRLQGRSSGDGRAPKYPVWTAVGA